MKRPEHCPACQGSLAQSETVQLIRTDPWRYLRCAKCGLLVINPFPKQEEIVSFYSDASYGLGATKFPVWLEWFRDRSQEQRAAWVQSRGAAGGAVLDIGCGSGVFLKSMAARGYQCFGTELAGPAAERARAVPGLQLSLGDLGENAFSAGYFEAITLWHVLEHLPDPAGTLRCCRRFLRTTGQLFLEVPNLSSWQARLFGRHWLHLDPPRHLYQFTAPALEALLRQEGFEVIERSTFSLSMGWLGALQSALNVFMNPRDLLYHVLLTRGRCHVSAPRKAAALLAGLIGSPVALLFCLIEASVGRGAVLRYRCRLS